MPSEEQAENELQLRGCRPVPLAHYLKALGVLRLVSEQADAQARGFWRDEHFVLTSRLDEGGLIEFFTQRYAPSPLITPWNGGGGFYPKDNKKGIEPIESSPAQRFTNYREAIAGAKRILQRAGIDEKVGKEEKGQLLEQCRAKLPDAAVEWLDAAYVLSRDGAKYPPLLGTGGNDGRLDFTNNFMQRLVELIDTETGAPLPDCERLLRAALTGDATTGLSGAAIGQFQPGTAGGANSGTGFDGNPGMNPWDYVLMLEGALVFAGAAVRKLGTDTSGALAFPFTVRASGVGYPSAAAEDETPRGEMWLPLWRRAARAAEVYALFSEGRARVGDRSARNGVDFARAVASLGVDRGLSSFQRYGFQVRNGLSYFATPLNRVNVRANAAVGLLEELDGWLDRARSAAGSAPASISAALRSVDAAAFDLCLHGDGLRVLRLLVALGRCERQLATSLRWATEHLDPVPSLRSQWLLKANDRSPELRLAAALASSSVSFKVDGRQQRRSLRSFLEQVDIGVRSVRWRDGESNSIVWRPGDFTGVLLALLRRWLLLLEGSAGFDVRARVAAEASDIDAFITGRVSETRLEDVLWACALVDWRQAEGLDSLHSATGDVVFPNALYRLAKLCFVRPEPGDSDPMPLVPRIVNHAAGGDATRASELAAARLRASGVPPALAAVHLSAAVARRTAAAIAFPINRATEKRLRTSVLRPSDEPDSSGSAAAESSA